MDRNSRRESKSTRGIALLAVLIPLAAGLPLRGNTIFSQGTFGSDDHLELFPIHLAIQGTVTLQTFSYAGGMSALGNPVSPGGFDPVITLFDSAGNFQTTNNDGACGTVGMDLLTLNCFDSYLSLTLGPGDYTLVLTENDNLAIGPTLADSFTQVGNGNFTCPEFLGIGGGFCDASPSQRNSAWALDIVTPSATGATPEPQPSLLLLSGIALFALARKSLKGRKL